MTKEEFINERTRIISEMLANPDNCGIYPTTKCFNELDDLFDKITSDNGDIVPMNGKVLGNNVLIKVEEKKEEKINGIIIPDVLNKKPNEGKVVMVGNGKLLDNGYIVPMNVKVGDNVVFEKYAISNIEIDNKKYYIVSEDAILMIKEV